MPSTPTEIASDDEIRSARELVAGLPGQNLTIAGLARKLASQITRPAIPDTEARSSSMQSQQQQLKSVVRYAPVSVENAWRMSNTKRLGVETVSYRFDFSNGLSGAGVWLKGIAAPDNGPVTIVLNDKGYKESGEIVAEHVNRGEQVLALDLLFNGSMTIEAPSPASWELLVATTGDRPLGLEVAQLLAVARWVRGNLQSRPKVETDGMRNQVIASIAAAIENGELAEVRSENGIKSLSFLLDKSVPYRSAPDLFCLDLFKYFDLDRLSAIAQANDPQATGESNRR